MESTLTENKLSSNITDSQSDELEEYKGKIIGIIRRELAKKALSFDQVVRKCRGAYPTIVADCLETVVDRTSFISQKTIKLREDILGDSEAVFQTDLLENNPVLASWYFTKDTCDALGKLRNWKDRKIAFLGTPRLYEWFRFRNYGKTRVLFDLDEVVIDSLRSEVESNQDELLVYDVCEELSDKYLDKFDCVFFDPPWYFGHYQTWLKRAVELAPKGSVFFSVFPELTRPSAHTERDRLIERCELALNNFTLFRNFLEYEVPTFEREQLRNQNLGALPSWRLGDLAVAEAVKTVIYLSPKNEPFKTEWIEIDINSIRIFINVKKTFSPSNLNELLTTVSSSLFLPSPSRRSREFQRANVITSRGHGLVTNNSQKLISLLHYINQRLTDLDLNDIVDNLPTDQNTIALMKKILF